MSKILLIFGTRPELIKLAPIVIEFDKRGIRDNLITINTNQHNSLLHEVIEEFSIEVDYTLNINNSSNNLSILSTEIIAKLEHLLQKIQLNNIISSIIVQGDTTSTYCASLVAFYNKIPLHYIEAGLRTYDNKNPFPEEFHRRVISHAADWLYAPTESAKQNLINEGFHNDKIIVTGNTSIDSIMLMEKMNLNNNSIESHKKIVLCTIHRRENHGTNIDNYINSIIKLAKENSEYEFIIIRHPNPEVKQIIDKYSSTHIKNLIISNPLSYSKMLNLIRSSQLIISDSGGLQEEASYFLKPIIVLRSTTERIESIQNNIAVCIKPHNHDIEPLFNAMKDMKIDKNYKYIYGKGNGVLIIVNNILRPTKNIMHLAVSAKHEVDSNN